MRLISLAMVGLLFAETLFLVKNRIQGWTFYLSTGEVVFEVVVRLAFGALAAILMGALLTVAVAGVLRSLKDQQRAANWVVTTVAVMVLFFDSRMALGYLVRWSGRGTRFLPALLIAHLIFFAVAIFVPRLRTELASSLDLFLGRRTARGMVIGAIAMVILLAIGEFAIGSSLRTVKASTAATPKSNIVLITFDALSAEDMSLYGYKLPTTPNIDKFAQNATVFSNFYSTSTFTTPCIATMMTGGYPTETQIHQLQAHLPGDVADQTLANVMQAEGYATGAFLTNPFAYFVSENPKNGFEFLPEPAFQAGGLQFLWSVSRPLHQNSGFGSRVAEYIDLETAWNSLAHIPGNLSMRYRPDASFRQARQLVHDLPDGFFLWVHVITPHHPYLPDAADEGRFLPAQEGRRFAEESELQWQPHYAAEEQAKVDRRRLLYDEFLLSADRAFGDFITDLDRSGKASQTTVIVSADHGESFEGGVFRHESPYLTRPDIHVPLIIRKAGQKEGREIDAIADQTDLAPTVLDLASVKTPEWMHGQSLMRWTDVANSADQGVAYSQFVERNSIFEPLRHGMIGVIKGKYEYVLDLDTKKGALRPMAEAQFWNIDRSSENQEQAAALREMIFARFPELRKDSR